MGRIRYVKAPQVVRAGHVHPLLCAMPTTYQPNYCLQTSSHVVATTHIPEYFSLDVKWTATDKEEQKCPHLGPAF